MVRMKHQELLKGLIRLHILHHASQEAFYGQWMIHELARHGYTLSPGTLYPMLHGLERRELTSLRGITTEASVTELTGSTPGLIHLECCSVRGTRRNTGKSGFFLTARPVGGKSQQLTDARCGSATMLSGKVESRRAAHPGAPVESDTVACPSGSLRREVDDASARVWAADVSYWPPVTCNERY